ncbi:MAG TPA: hypothetical protein VGF24_37205 [Vicinamibacterales bacterium]|jgi:hypothetical protein
MGIWVLEDRDKGRAVLFDSVTEKPLRLQAFFGPDATSQADHFIAWFDGIDLNESLAALSERDLDNFYKVWFAGAFNEFDEFVGVMPDA